MSRLRCASCQKKGWISDFKQKKSHKQNLTRPVDLIPCFQLSKIESRGSSHVLQHSIVHEELVVCHSCDYQCKSLPGQCSQDSGISWHFVLKMSPASNFLSLISTKILNASAAVSRASCRFFLPRLSWLILSWSQKEVNRCEKNQPWGFTPIQSMFLFVSCWAYAAIHGDFQLLSTTEALAQLRTRASRPPRADSCSLGTSLSTVR